MKSFSMSGLSFSRGRGSLCPYNVDSEAFSHIMNRTNFFSSILTRVVLSEGRTVTALAASVTAEAAALTPDIQTGDDLDDDHQIGVIND